MCKKGVAIGQLIYVPGYDGDRGARDMPRVAQLALVTPSNPGSRSSACAVVKRGDDSRPISCGHRWLLLLEHGKGIGMYRIAYECEWILLDPVGSRPVVSGRVAAVSGGGGASGLVLAFLRSCDTRSTGFAGLWGWA